MEAAPLMEPPLAVGAMVRADSGDGVLRDGLISAARSDTVLGAGGSSSTQTRYIILCPTRSRTRPSPRLSRPTPRRNWRCFCALPVCAGSLARCLLSSCAVC